MLLRKWQIWSKELIASEHSEGVLLGGGEDSGDGAVRILVEGVDIDGEGSTGEDVEDIEISEEYKIIYWIKIKGEYSFGVAVRDRILRARNDKSAPSGGEEGM